MRPDACPTPAVRSSAFAGFRFLPAVVSWRCAGIRSGGRIATSKEILVERGSGSITSRCSAERSVSRCFSLTRGVSADVESVAVCISTRRT